MPATLSVTWWYPDHTTFVLTSVGWSMTYNPGSIAMPGLGTFTGYWISGCVDLSSFIDCSGADPDTGLPAQNGAGCYAKYALASAPARTRGAWPRRKSGISDPSCGSVGSWHKAPSGGGSTGMWATGATSCTPFLWPVGPTGAGQYVAPPGVRLLAVGDAALLAYTGFDGANYTVEAVQVTGGRLGSAERLSPAGADAALGDASVDAKGAQLVAWRFGAPGNLPGGQPAQAPLLANVRSATGGAFGSAEAIGPAGTDLPYAPSTAIDPVSGGAIVAYGTLTPPVVQVAARPAW